MYIDTIIINDEKYNVYLFEKNIYDDIKFINKNTISNHITSILLTHKKFMIFTKNNYLITGIKAKNINEMIIILNNLIFINDKIPLLNKDLKKIGEFYREENGKFNFKRKREEN